MLEELHVPLTGRLVVLEPVAAPQEADLARAAQDGEVWTWIAMGGGPADESLRRWSEWARPPEVLAFATVRREDDWPRVRPNLERRLAGRPAEPDEAAG